MAMKEETNTPLLLTVGAVSALLVLITYIGGEALFRSEQRRETENLWQESPNTWLIDLRDPQLDHLKEPDSFDPKTGLKHVSIDESIDALVANGGLPPKPVVHVKKRPHRAE